MLPGACHDLAAELTRFSVRLPLFLSLSLHRSLSLSRREGGDYEEAVGGNGCASHSLLLQALFTCSRKPSTSTEHKYPGSKALSTAIRVRFHAISLFGRHLTQIVRNPWRALLCLLRIRVQRHHPKSVEQQNSSAKLQTGFLLSNAKNLLNICLWAK